MEMKPRNKVQRAGSSENSQGSMGGGWGRRGGRGREEQSLDCSERGGGSLQGGGWELGMARGDACEVV